MAYWRFNRFEQKYSVVAAGSAPTGVSMTTAS